MKEPKTEALRAIASELKRLLRIMTHRVTIDAAIVAVAVGVVLGSWTFSHDNKYLAGAAFTVALTLLGWFRYKEKKSSALTLAERLLGSFLAGVLISIIPAVGYHAFYRHRWFRNRFSFVVTDFIIGAVGTSLLEAVIAAAALLFYKSVPVATDAEITLDP